MNNSVFTHIEYIKHRRFDKDKVSVPAHNHNFYEITYVLDGCFHADIDSSHYELGTNTMFLAPPKAMHSHNSDDSYEVIYAGFYYNGSHGMLNQHVINDKDNIVLNILNMILAEYKNADTNYENICLELQKILVFTLLRLQGNSITSDNETILKYAVSYLQDHYYDDIDMRQLANSLGYSYDHFRHIFKESFGVPPKQFLLNQRMQYAIRLLRDTDESISNIAKSCGFTSTTRFISTFKSLFSTSPMQYRNSDTINIETVNWEDKTITAKPYKQISNVDLYLDK